LTMEERNNPAFIKVSPAKKAEKGPAGPSDLVKHLVFLPGSEVINRILDLEHAEKAVRGLPHSDLYWLIKKIGEGDALPLLKLASTQQWQFLLDLEAWDRDRLDMEQATIWLGRLFQADPERVSNWLLTQGELFTYCYFANKIEVHVRERDEFFEDTTFLSFDDIYYFRVCDAEEGDLIQELLRRLAEKDLLGYQAIMLGLAGTLRDEVEEEIYRLRNVRIAEDGFLPYEEAVSLYAYLAPDALKAEKGLLSYPAPAIDPPPAPLAPILQVKEDSLFLKALTQEGDPALLDRIRLEFAGLCNQIISADRIKVSEAEDLVRVCRKAAGYINAGLERLAGESLERCRNYLMENPLQHLFRVGFSLALQVKWEAERWVKEAWFVRSDLKPAFWGEWGGFLVGILQKRPLLYRGPSSHPAYSHFEDSTDLQGCREILQQMKALDSLLERISSGHPVEKEWAKEPFFTFHALILNFWARQKLNIQPGFAPLSLQDVTRFFRLLRSGSDSPPFRMEEFKEIFVQDLAAYGGDLNPESIEALRPALCMVWDKFTEEYAWVATADLDGRYLKFILTSPAPGGAPR
jgi:hypothetical protein